MHPTSKVLIALTAGLVTACSSGGDGDGGNGPPPTTTEFLGVIGGNDGIETGSLSLTLENDGSGSGSFKIGTTVTSLTSVSTTGTQLNAAGGGYSFTGTVSGVVIDGSYTSPGGGGLLAAMEQAATVELVQFCSFHDAGVISGVYVLVLNTSTEAIRGVWTSGPVSAFKGVVSGFAGDSAGVMSGHPGTVSIIPDLPNGTVAGSYDLASGEQGTISGPVCP
jgi:hypothetical protein